MNLEHATPELFAALAVAQVEVDNVLRNAVNTHLKTKYADLGAVLATVRPAFAKHGLGVLQSTAFDGNRVTVVTALTHSGGGFVTSEASCVPPKPDAQGIGAATTYLRRYALAAIAGVAQEDDDGNSARHTRESKREEPSPSRWQAHAETLQACASLSALAAAWQALPTEARKDLLSVKEACKAAIQAADAELAEAAA